MKIEIIYIHHNCFVIKYLETAFLFDRPAVEFLEHEEIEAITRNIRGRKLYVFISHAHPDHYGSGIFELSNICPDAHYIISDDITELGSRNNLLVAEAEKTYFLDNLEVRTFKSNDAGLAYLIKTSDAKIYFGGDLAKWKSDELDSNARGYMEKLFNDTVGILKEENIDISFSNADARTPNYSGAADFIKVTRPKIFVPMHLFGNVDAIKDFVKTFHAPETKIFEYSKPGDVIIFE